MGNRLMDRVTKRWVQRALKRANGNRRIAAEYLGVSRRTLQNWEVRFELRQKLPCKRKVASSK